MKESQLENSNELVLVIQSQNVEKEYKENALQAYRPFMQELQDVSLLANSINFENPTSEDSATARRLRIQLVKVRTGAESKKKERKESILLLGKLEDHATGVVVTASKLMEERLDKVEKYVERLAEDARQKIKSERLLLLNPFNVDAKYIHLESMSDSDFEKLLSDSEILHNAKIEAEKKKETERIAFEKQEEIKREEQRLENERLKAEMQRECEEASKREAELRAENERQSKLIADQKAKEEQDRRKAENLIAEQKENERKASLDPDREKLLQINDQLDALIYPINVTSNKAKLAINDTFEMVEKLKKFIIKRSEEL